MDWSTGKEPFREAMIRTRSESTSRRYVQGVENLIDWIDATDPPLDGSEPGVLDSFVTYLSDKRNLSPRTISVHVAAVFRYFDWMRRRGKEVPVFLRPELPRIEDEDGPKKVLSTEELRRFLGAVSRMTEPLRTALWILPRTGLRSIELVSLKVTEVFVFKDDSGESWVVLKVRGKGRKRRLVPIFRSGGKLLSIYLRGWRSKVRSEYLFPAMVNGEYRVTAPHITTRTLRENTQVLRELLGIDGLSPHALRRTYNTMLDDAGVSPYIAAQLMGHRVRGEGTTPIAQNHYVRHSIEKLVDSIRNIDVPEVGTEILPPGTRHRRSLA